MTFLLPSKKGNCISNITFEIIIIFIKFINMIITFIMVVLGIQILNAATRRRIFDNEILSRNSTIISKFNSTKNVGRKKLFLKIKLCSFKTF